MQASILPVSIAQTAPATLKLTPYTDAKDRSNHLDNMQRLAQETDYPLQVITPIYEETLTRLRQNAIIHDYLPILVSKGVKKLLKKITQRT